MRVCLSVTSLGFLEGGGHRWAYLNWALGLKSIGCEVTWLEEVAERIPDEEIPQRFEHLKGTLEPHELGGGITLLRPGARCMSAQVPGCLPFEEAAQADLLINLKYSLDAQVVRRFRRSALVDIDPGTLQIWMSRGDIHVAPHDLYFSIGETVGTSEARFPDAGLEWHHTPPPVSLDSWPVSPAAPDSSFCTVSNWYGGRSIKHDDKWYDNTKRAGFLPYLELPRHTSEKLELALFLSSAQEDRADLEARGWSVKHARDVAGSPDQYQSYIRRSKGEFSCAKPVYVLLQTAWVSDRTICFLAAGKPALVEHTGPSRFLPDGSGLLRFHDVPSAVRSLEAVAADYSDHARNARALAEEYFDARAVTSRVVSMMS